MNNVVDFLIQKLGEGFSWLKSQVQAFFQFISKQTKQVLKSNKCLNIKQDFTALKDSISEATAKVFEHLDSLRRASPSSFDEMKKNFNSCIKRLLGFLLDQLRKMYLAAKEFTVKIAKEFSATSFGSKVDEFMELIVLVEGLIELVNIIQYKPLMLAMICFQANSLFRKNGSKSVGKMEKDGYFLNWQGNMRKAAMFVYIVLDIGTNQGNK